MQPLRQLMPDKGCCVQQPLHRAFGFCVTPLDYNENPRRPAICRKLYFTDIHQADAGITQFTLQNCFDLLAQRLALALAVVFLTAAFQNATSKNG